MTKEAKREAMKDGWWIRIDNGEAVPVRDHEIAIRRPEVAHQLGVPVSVFKRFGEYTPGKDRCSFLIFVMQHAPVMRVRGHGIYVSFEFHSTDGDGKAFRAVSRWAAKHAGEATLLNVTNLATGRNVKVFALLWDDFVRKDSVKTGGELKGGER